MNNTELYNTILEGLDRFYAEHEVLILQGASERSLVHHLANSL